MIKQFIAEFLGTFILVLAIFATGQAIPIGIALALSIYIVGTVSGGHLNPAVSVGMLASKSIDSKTCLVYILAQILGGLFAYVVYKNVISKDAKTQSY